MPQGLRSVSAAIAAAAMLMLVLTGCGGKRPPAGPAESVLAKAAVANSRGVRAYNSGRYERAAGLFAESLAINRSLDNRAAEVTDLINLGRTYASMGDIPGATGFLDDAAHLASSMDDKRLVSEVYATRARVEYMGGDHRGALEHLGRSLELDAETGLDDIGGKLNLKGVLLVVSGDTKAARSTLERALRINAEHGSRSEEANSLRELAALDRAAGELASARKLLERAYDIDRELANPARIATDLERMADVELSAGRNEEAVFLLDRAYQVNLSAGMTTRALTDMDMILATLDGSGDTDGAERYRARKQALEEMLQEREP